MPGTSVQIIALIGAPFQITRHVKHRSTHRLPFSCGHAWRVMREESLVAVLELPGDAGSDDGG
jgi:hypothetical protein